ncbi:response regulator [Phenylobacterium sp.]|uniref:response regulator transcription factor n=1 Tax=Phenylobacterium sp. TaxID=1871053 RepID=UPI00262A51D5|nr:response regulator [Phenylobacterium sp.]
MKLSQRRPERLADVTPPALVHIVEDDLIIGMALQDLLMSIGLESTTYASLRNFHAADLPDRPSCILTDVRLPDGNGLDLLAHAGRSESYPPVIIMTGYADVELSVRAMRDGAADFLTKPLREQDLLDAVTAALAVDQQRWFQRRESQRLRRCFDSLSERQRQVIELVANGRLNKQAAAELDLSETTVKTHRRLAMQKMQARGTADLVRMAVQLGLSV